VKMYRGYLQKNQITIEAEPQVVNLFFSDKVELRTDNAPVVNLTPDKFKDFLRQSAKKSSLSDEAIKKITEQLPVPQE